MSDPLTGEELAAIEADHQEEPGPFRGLCASSECRGGDCDDAGPWPCTTSRLVAEVRRLRASRPLGDRAALMASIAKAVEESRGGDAEKPHQDADDALLVYIGDVEIAEAYDLVKKWYA
jgi:hypothetical protein